MTFPWNVRVVLAKAALLLAIALAHACSGQSHELPGFTDDGQGARAQSGDAGADAASSPRSRRDAGEDAWMPRLPPGEVEPDPQDESTYLYDQTALRTYELRIEPSALAILDADPRAEEYVEGRLLFEGKDYGPVGVRYKGSVGAWGGCTAREGFWGGGAKTCTKLSIKVKINWNDPDAEFYGVRKLQFHSMNRDPSMMKERLAYWLFRQFGIASPRSVHARLIINGQLSGLYALVEQIDGRFTRSRFTEGGKGNLYKEAWPLTAAGDVTPAGDLLPQLKTNEDDNPSFDRFQRFGRALAQAEEEELASALEPWLDLDYMARYLAVDRATGNDDGVLHWYCLPGPCWNHNYYWYEETWADRLWLIPWDMDGSFNLDHTTTTLWFDWTDTSLGCGALVQSPFNVPQRISSCDKLIRAWSTLEGRLREARLALLDGPYRPELVEARLQEWEAQIEAAVEEAAATHDDAVTLEAWRAAGQALRATIAELRNRTRERVGLPPIEGPPADAGVDDASLPLDASSVAVPDAEAPEQDGSAGGPEDAGLPVDAGLPDSGGLADGGAADARADSEGGRVADGASDLDDGRSSND